MPLSLHYQLVRDDSAPGPARVCVSNDDGYSISTWLEVRRGFFRTEVRVDFSLCLTKPDGRVTCITDYGYESFSREGDVDAMHEMDRLARIYGDIFRAADRDKIIRLFTGG